MAPIYNAEPGSGEQILERARVGTLEMVPFASTVCGRQLDRASKHMERIDELRKTFDDSLHAATCKGIAHSRIQLDFPAIADKFTRLRNAWLSGDKAGRKAGETDLRKTLLESKEVLKKEANRLTGRQNRGEHELALALSAMLREKL